jgi:polyhydroxybutyrate depolymerase
MTFVDAILEQVSKNYCVNRNEVFAIGHSLWGWMAQRIACLRGEFFSGLAVVGSWPYTGTCSWPVPSLFFQNVDDPLSSYASGISARNTRVKADECSESTENIPIGPLTCLRYNSCSTDNEVVWCEGYTGYGGDPHSWPVGERGSRGYSETGGTWILDYFKNLK